MSLCSLHSVNSHNGMYYCRQEPHSLSCLPSLPIFPSPRHPTSAPWAPPSSQASRLWCFLSPPFWGVLSSDHHVPFSLTLFRPLLKYQLLKGAFSDMFIWNTGPVLLCTFPLASLPPTSYYKSISVEMQVQWGQKLFLSCLLLCIQHLNTY